MHHCPNTFVGVRMNGSLGSIVISVKLCHTKYGIFATIMRISLAPYQISRAVYGGIPCGTFVTAVQNLRTSREVNSLISSPSGIESDVVMLARPQPVIPSYLQPGPEFRMCQQVEQYITSLWKQIADGCTQAFESQKSPITQSIRQHIESCHSPQRAAQLPLTLRPLLPKQVALISGSQLIPPCLSRQTLRVRYMIRGSQQPPYRTEHKHRSVSKRGRPAKYASQEEKAAVDAARRRVKRLAQRQMALDRRAEDFFQFCQVT